MTGLQKSTIAITLILIAASPSMVQAGNPAEMIGVGSKYSTTVKSHSNYYASQLKTHNRPVTSVSNYLIDTHFSNRPTLSPYLSLTRRSGAYSSNYHSYVRPELNRRSSYKSGIPSLNPIGAPFMSTPMSPYGSVSLGH